MNETKTQVNTELVSALFAAGAHFGYSKTKRHPSAKPFLFGTKNRVDIMNLEETSTMLANAQEFMASLANTGKMILFVGSKPEAKATVRSIADKIDMPFVDVRWIGGTLTNYDEIRKRVDRFKKLTEQKAEGSLVYQTKKELLMLEREMEKLEKKFGGLVRLERKPDAMFVVDSKHEQIAVKEATELGIPVISISNSDCDLSLVTYPILANDSSRSSIEFIANELVNAYLKARTS